MQNYIESNKKNWNERVHIHAKSQYYDIAGFLNGNSTLKGIELNEIGDFKDKKILHLQCHFGLDTLSMAREGANVLGVDLSDKAIDLARELAKQSRIDARFICANVLELDKFLDEEFDVVFASYGILCWIPDLIAWFGIGSKFLRDGGKLILIDGHPINNMLEYNEMNELEIEYGYFNDGVNKGESKTTYVGDKQIQDNNLNFQWSHSMSDIIMGGLANGLKLVSFKEYPYTTYKKYPSMIEREDKYWEQTKYNIPLLYSVKFLKEEK